MTKREPLAPLWSLALGVAMGATGGLLSPISGPQLSHHLCVFVGVACLIAALLTRTARIGVLLFIAGLSMAGGRSLAAQAQLRELQSKMRVEGGLHLRIAAVAQDGAKAIMFGSTTMALTAEMWVKAQGRPLFMPGMTALRTIEHLWFDDLWPGKSG